MEEGQIGLEDIGKAVAKKSGAISEETTEAKSEPTEAKAEEVKEKVAESSATEEQSSLKSETGAVLDSPEKSAEETKQPTETTAEWNEQYAKLAEQNGYVKPQDEDEFISRIKQLRSEGVDVENPDFWAEKTVDYSTFDPKDPKQAQELIQKELKIKRPDYNSLDVQDHLEESYPELYESFNKTEDDFDTDAEYESAKEKWNDKVEKAKRRLTRDANGAIATLKERQEKFGLPSSKETQEQREQREAQQAAAIQAYNNYADKKVKSFEKLGVEVEGVGHFEVEVDDSTRSNVLKTMTNLNEHWNKYFSENPNDPLSDDITTDLAWASKEFREKALNVIVEQAIAKSQTEIIDAQKNQKAPSSHSSESKETIDIMRQIGTQVIKNSH